MPRIGVILGSTSPGRRAEPVARWVMDIASRRSDGEFELVDLADYPRLPHLDEPLPPNMGQYQNTHTKDWAATIGRFDGVVFVTPKYNHFTSGVLKNAIDYVYAEWNQIEALDALLGQVIAWRDALAPLRQIRRAA